jgi:solute carrier family 25 carnitine/acylcarnitine transporter 20/29
MELIRCFFAGLFGGICQAIVSHPLDLIKSRVQNGVYPSARTCLVGTYKTEGLLAFYKGVSPPIAIAGFYNATLFATNAMMHQRLRAAFSIEPGTPLPLPLTALGGLMTAPIAVAVLNPAEVIKIRLQMQTGSAATAQYSGMIDCARQVLRTDGPKILFRGYFPTLGTRALGLPCYFTVNEMSRGLIRENFPGVSKEMNYALSGGFGGIAFWLACYPFDLIKTRTQAAKAAGGISAKELAKTIYSTQGMAGFYKGMGACMLRAVPANATVFLAMEYASDKLKANGL